MMAPWMRAGIGSAALAALLLPGQGFAAEFDCVIEPSKTVEVRAPAEGLIEKILVDRGDIVKTGQVLVVLDSGVEREAAESARFRSTMKGRILASDSRAEYATIKHNRREQLVEQSFISTQDRDEALAEKRLAEAEVIAANEDRRLAEIEYRRLSEQLRLRTIKSPVDGIVVDRMLTAGELADNRDLRKPILRLADIGKLHVEVLMPLEAFGKLALGQRVEVLPEPTVGGRYTATVKVIDRVHDAASGTFGVRLEMANSGLKLPAGIKCKASFPAVGTPPGTSPAGASAQERKPPPRVPGKPM